MATRITLQFNDRDGNLGQCSTSNTGLNAVSDLVAEANAYGSFVSGISDAALVGATLSRRVSLSIPSADNSASNVRRSLLLLFRNPADVLASIVVPSARVDLPYDTVGPYAGIRISPDVLLGPSSPIADLLTYLNGTVVRPDGGSVAFTEVIGGLLLNEE